MADTAPLPPAELLYEQAACGLLLTSPNGTIRRANVTFCRWIGYAEEELVDRRRLPDLLNMGGRIFHQTHWAPLLQMQGSIAEVKLDVLHKDGRAIPMLMNAAVFRVGDEVWHQVAVLVAEDRHKYERELLQARRRAEELAAQEKQAQEALREAQAELTREHAAAEDRALFAEQMVSIVSHDLRNPLAAVQMGAHILGTGDLSPAQRTTVGRIDNSTRRALRLITQLLDFTQVRMGAGIVVSPVPVDLHALVAESVEELATAYAGRELVHTAEGAGACRADPDRLTQLVGNLVSNAMSYGAPERPVRVTSAIVAGGFELSVHNEGTPIPAEIMERLFEPMVRGADRTRPGVGAGAVHRPRHRAGARG